MAKKIKTPGVHARGNSIQIDFRYKGVRCRETLNIKPTDSNLKQAQHFLAKIQQEIASGNFNYLDYFPNRRIFLNPTEIEKWMQGEQRNA